MGRLAKGRYPWFFSTTREAGTESPCAARSKVPASRRQAARETENASSDRKRRKQNINICIQIKYKVFVSGSSSPWK